MAEISQNTVIRRGPAEYAQGFASLLPTGRAWPRNADSVLMRLIAGLADIWGSRVDARAVDLLVREADPRTTVELIGEWERAFGLPDPCLGEAVTIADRQRLLVQRITMSGDPTPEFFVELAASLGYTLTIKEHSPFMAGISRAGDTRTPGAASSWFRWEIGGEDMRPYWTVLLKHPRLSWFRAGSGQAGVDPHLRVAISTDLECILKRFKPAHTRLAFDYSGVDLNSSMAGTP